MSEAALALPDPAPTALLLRVFGDERLVRWARSGDDQAFAAIYERYRQPLYRYCRAILNHPEDASDALHNTFVSAMRAMPGSRREIALRPWLFRIAHNESVSILRRRRSHAELGEADGFEARGGDAEARERFAELIDDLRLLPDRQRGALVMRELSGLGYPEIAGALGISEAAAKQAVYKARLTLVDFAAGRGMQCNEVQATISASDRRSLRARKLRAHVRSCSSCSNFERSIASRSRALGALAPPMATPALAFLQGLLGKAGGGGGGGLLPLFGAGSGVAGPVKAVGVGLVAVAVAGGVTNAPIPGIHDDGSAGPAAPALASRAPSPSGDSAFSANGSQVGRLAGISVGQPVRSAVSRRPELLPASWRTPSISGSSSTSSHATSMPGTSGTVGSSPSSGGGGSAPPVRVVPGTPTPNPPAASPSWQPSWQSPSYSPPSWQAASANWGQQAQQFSQAVTQQAFQAAGAWVSQAQQIQQEALSSAQQAMGSANQLLQNLQFPK